MTEDKKTQSKTKHGFSQEILNQAKATKTKYAATGKVRLELLVLKHWQSEWGDEELPLI
ncbi:MAG: hypothetical protein ACEQSC_00660 [Candidatus Nanopelagicaceae bacterium]